MKVNYGILINLFGSTKQVVLNIQPPRLLMTMSMVSGFKGPTMTERLQDNRNNGRALFCRTSVHPRWICFEEVRQHHVIKVRRPKEDVIMLKGNQG